MKSYFIAGTDTEIGKTLITGALVLALRKVGKTAQAIKWVSAGAKQIAGQWRNEDGLCLQSLSTASVDYEQINPFVLPEAASPHIAAELAGVEITAKQVVDWHRQYAQTFDQDRLLIEGAGGWLVPLNSKESLADVVMALQIPVILVVGMRLGCLNHALLTAQAIESSGVELAGWIGNQLSSDMPHFEQNIMYLQQRIQSPCLGVVPYLHQDMRDTWHQGVMKAASCLSSPN